MNQGEVAALNYKARVAEQAERWGDLVAAMTHVVREKPQLDIKEVRLLATGLKNMIAPIRMGLRVAETAERKYTAKGHGGKQGHAAAYREQLAGELSTICKEGQSLVSQIQPINEEAKILTAKMSADYLRYLSELSGGGGSVDSVHAAYQQAFNMATMSLQPTNETRLGLALNFAVFTHDVMHRGEEACRMAEDAVALCQESGGAADTREAFVAESLLKSNANLWREEIKQQQQQTSQGVMSA